MFKTEKKELIEEVAERMGWKNIRNETEPPYRYSFGSSEQHYWRGYFPGEENRQRIPRYDICIQSAWELVSEAAKAGIKLGEITDLSPEEICKRFLERMPKPCSCHKVCHDCGGLKQ